MRLYRKIHNNSSYCFLLFHGFVRSKHKNNNNKKRKLSNPPLHLTLLPFKNYLSTKASFLERHDTQSIVWKIRFVVAWLAVLELAQAICPLHAHIRALLVLQLSTCFKQTTTQERGIGHEHVCHLWAVQCTSRLGSRADTSARPWRQKWPGIALLGWGPPLHRWRWPHIPRTISCQPCQSPGLLPPWAMFGSWILTARLSLSEDIEMTLTLTLTLMLTLCVRAPVCHEHSCAEVVHP